VFCIWSHCSLCLIASSGLRERSVFADTKMKTSHHMKTWPITLEERYKHFNHSREDYHSARALTHTHTHDFWSISEKFIITSPSGWIQSCTSAKRKKSNILWIILDLDLCKKVLGLMYEYCVSTNGFCKE